MRYIPAMRCFYHTDREAVAACRACSRGLCAECGEPLVRGFACRGECAEWGRDFAAMMDESIKNYRIRAQQQKELDEKKKQNAEAPAKLGEPLNVRQPGPTMRERAEGFRATTVSPHPPRLSSWRWNNGVFQLLIGLVLVVWGVINLDESLFVLIIGLILTGSGLYFIGFSRGRRWDMTKTASSKNPT